MRYRQIVPAEARQLPPLTPGWHEHGPLSLDELADWCGGQVFSNESGTYIVVPQDDNRAWPGDWLVKDVQGHFHKVGRDDFEQNFGPVEGQS